MIASSCITLINVIDGEDGISILSIDEQFSKSNSQDTVPTTNWTDILPQRNEGEILWKREVVRYSDSTIKILSPHPITGDKGDAGASGEISIGLGYKVNHTSLTSSNNGEIFAHGFTDGVAANMNGWIYFESIRYTVLVGYLNPGTVYKIFPYSSYIGIRKSSPSKIVAIRFNNSTKTFLFVDCENNYSGQVDETDWIIIGDFKMTNSEMIEYANFYNGGKSLQAIKEEELLESGKLVIDWSANTINIKALNNRGFISFNGNRLFLQSTSKTFSKKGEGLILANLNTDSILFSKIELGDTVYNNQNVKTINFLDYESLNVITTRHDILVDYGYIKIGEFIIDDSGFVKTAAITESEPIESYLQKAFMKLFKMGDITTSNFEDWLDAIDLKNFYQTLVVSTLFVNSLLANDGQFLNSLKITNNNIDPSVILNDNLDKVALFQNGLTLNSDGSIQANWLGLDSNGYPISGWKIDGSGQSFFNGSTIINANVKGLVADKITHNALKTVDEVDGATVDYSLAKNEWFSNDYLDLFESNHISRDNYNITCDGNTYDYFFKTGNSNQYLLLDTNNYKTAISAGDNKVLHNWTNTYGYPIFVECKATLSGTSNEIVWEIINSNNSRILSEETEQIVSFVLYPNETLQCRGRSWAWWGCRDAYVNYVKLHKSFSNGNEYFIELNNRVLVDFHVRNSTEIETNINITECIIPKWVDYYYIFIGTHNEIWKSDNERSEYVSFSYSIDGGSELIISPILNDRGRYSSYFKINCREYSTDITINLKANLCGDIYKEDDKTRTLTAKLNIDYIDYGYSVFISGNANGFALFDKSRFEKKYFLNETYYKNDISINSVISMNYRTKVNKVDFIKELYNSINSDLRDGWLVLTDAATHYISIDGVNIYIAQLFVTNSYIKAMLTTGEVATLIPNTRYSSISLYAIVASSTESIVTGHIIAKTTNRVIGDSEIPFQSAHINVVNAVEINASGGEFHGKVYAS